MGAVRPCLPPRDYPNTWAEERLSKASEGPVLDHRWLDRYLDSAPEVIRFVVVMYVEYLLSLRNVEDLLAGRGIGISHETVRLWWNRFGPVFAPEIRKKRIDRMRVHTHSRWHLDEVYVKINGEMHYLWRAVDHEVEVLDSLPARPVTKPLRSSSVSEP